MAKEEKQEGQKKMTYQELLKAASDLNAQNNYFKEQTKAMQQKIVELSNFAMFKRLDYLFEVVKYAEAFPEAFVADCKKEIVETIAVPAEEGAELKPEGGAVSE